MHHVYQRSLVEISKSAFAHNVSQLRTLMAPKTVFAPVLKVNAYGHGLHEMAAWCQENPQIDWICVALLSDAFALRTQGITKPILVIGSIDTNPTPALHHNIHLFVYSLEQAHTLHTIAMAHHAQFLIHCKVDTGLSRLGFLYTHSVSDIQKIAALSGLAIAGVYSHLAQAQAENPQFSQLQISRFQTVIAQLRTQQINPAYIHISNSAATMRFAIPECNLFRIGAAVYGLWPSAQTKKEVLSQDPNFSLKPVLSWKSNIMHIQHVDTGSFIGYNCTHQITRPSKIAVIPVGYHDGYDIQLSNNAQVIIHGQIAPVVGRICMNHMMVDITELFASIGDEVELVGH